MVGAELAVYRQDFAYYDAQGYKGRNGYRVLKITKVEDIGNGMVKMHTEEPHSLPPNGKCFFSRTQSHFQSVYADSDELQGGYIVNEFEGLSASTFVITAPYSSHINTSVCR